MVVKWKLYAGMWMRNVFETLDIQYALVFSQQMFSIIPIKPSAMSFRTLHTGTLSGLTIVILAGRQGMEQISVNNFTPLTVRRIKEWLFGGFTPLSSGISDFSFVRLLFTCLATPDFQSLEGDVGYSWSPSRSKFKEHTFVTPSDDEESSDDEDDTVTWLEYQARLVTNALRETDFYFEPYDEKELKAMWGKDLLESREDYQGKYKYKGKDHEVFWEAPWLLWDMEMEGRR